MVLMTSNRQELPPTGAGQAEIIAIPAGYRRRQYAPNAKTASQARCNAVFNRLNAIPP
jgi:hypothetical protein